MRLKINMQENSTTETLKYEPCIYWIYPSFEMELNRFDTGLLQAVDVLEIQRHKNQQRV